MAPENDDGIATGTFASYTIHAASGPGEHVHLIGIDVLVIRLMPDRSAFTIPYMLFSGPEVRCTRETGGYDRVTN